MGYLLNSSNLGGVGGELFSSQVCPSGAWGSTAYASGVVYVPCANGLRALSIKAGADPTFTSLWNFSGGFAGPPIVAGGAVWTFDISNGTLYALNPQTGKLVTKVALGSPDHFATPSVADGLIVCAAGETVYGLDTSK